MSKILKTGVIGCGVVSLSHIDSYRKLPEVKLTSICDIRPDRLAATQERYPDLEATEYDSVDALLENGDIDAVSVCTDHASHEAIALQCLKAGKHVICEKALTTNLESLERMVAAANSSGLVTGAIFQHRFDSVYRACKGILADGLLGELLMVSAQHQCFRSEAYYTQDPWRGKWDSEGGSLLINQSIHFLDLIQWITGGVHSVSAQYANRAHEGIIETEDTASVALELNSGALASFIATSGSHRLWDSWFQFVGTNGDFRLENGALQSCSHADEAIKAEIEKRLSRLDEEEGVEGAKDYYGPSHPAQIRDFIQAIREKRKPFVDFTDARDSVALVLAIYESGRTGQRVIL